jgi:hypothetical protein
MEPMSGLENEWVDHERLRKIFQTFAWEIVGAFVSYRHSVDSRFDTIEAKIDSMEAGLSERLTTVERRLDGIGHELNPPA